MFRSLGLIVATAATFVVVGLLVLGVYTASAESESVEPLVYDIGDNNYVYEFRSVSFPDTLCIWVDSYQSGGLQCWKEENQ